MRRLSAFLLICAFSFPATAQDIPSPAEFLGYELGSRFTRHHQVVDYFRHVSELSNRVTLHQYGETYEGRPLLAAFLSTPDRQDMLEDIRRDNLRLTGIEDGEPEGDTPAIVWLSYNVHGNESVSTEASMATLYEMVRPGGSGDSWLANTVVVIDPCINPDGRDRYVNWYNQVVGFRPNADPDAREHFEPWPGGRTNHYNFDLNRDWAWQTQKESQERMALFNTWLPQVHVDFHEQGVNSPYYFAPAAEPYHDAITDWQRAFQDSIGTNHARYFDAEGWLYFTREVFDLFYPGYGDTYPTFNGGIGMTYEQGGSGRAGLAIETAEGDTLTLADRILHHHTTGLSTVETASRLAERLIDEFRAFYEAEPAGAFRAYVMKATSGQARLNALAGHLDKLGIEYGTVSSGRAVRGHDYRTASMSNGRVEPGDLVVSLAQPKATLTRVLLEPEATLPDSLTYDITAWALPYAYGLDGMAVSDDIQPDAAFSKGQPAATAGEQSYAFALRWDSPDDVVFLSAVLEAGIDARVAVEPFEVDGARFGPGTVLFTRAANEQLGASLAPRLATLASEYGAELVPMAGGRVDSGSDFGSNRVRFISAPRVAVATGSPVSQYGAGVVWHWFEQQLGYQVTMVNADRLTRVDLDEFDVLILPTGGYGSVLRDAGMDALRSWVRGGGRLIAIDGAARFLVGQEGFELVRKSADEDDEESEEEDDPLRRYADRTRDGLTENVPGAVFATRVDDSHPLGFGMSRGYYTLRRSGSGYAYLEDGWNVGVLEGGSRLSGHVGVDATPEIEESLAFGVQEMGSGAVVYLLDDPVYRGFWYEGRLLLGNAVFMPLR
ncbi:MAG: hypothetical protein JJ896_04185 [Rhodothermales bacterium]|nr:hypothetical protein [Rhodothermales bacterium]MBO6778832.1 hypothetical protein [Rhodothermales bacterium]